MLKGPLHSINIKRASVIDVKQWNRESCFQASSLPHHALLHEVIRCNSSKHFSNALHPYDYFASHRLTLCTAVLLHSTCVRLDRSEPDYSEPSHKTDCEPEPDISHRSISPF